MEMSVYPTKLPKLPANRAKNAISISFMNLKGGCGKTSLGDAVAHRLVMQGNNVLIIDNDPQCNISQRLGVHDELIPDNRVGDFYDALARNRFDDKTIELPVSVLFPKKSGKTGVLGLLAGSKDAEGRAGIPWRANPTGTRALYKTRTMLYKNNFDYIITDTAPAIYNNAVNDLVANASDAIVIPFDGNEAVNGLNNLFEWLYINTNRVYPPKILFAMTKYQQDTVDILTNQIDRKNPRVKVPDEYNCSMFRIMKKLTGIHMCDVGIPESRKLRTHTYMGLENSNKGKKKYDSLCDEIVTKSRSVSGNLIARWKPDKIADNLVSELKNIETARNRKMLHSIAPLKYV